MRKNGMVTN